MVGDFAYAKIFTCKSIPAEITVDDKPFRRFALRQNHGYLFWRPHSNLLVWHNELHIYPILL